MGGVRKPFLRLAGEYVLVRSLRPFLADDRVVSVAVALASDDAADPPPWLTALDARIQVVAGGQTRGESVARCLDALPEDLHVIAVHDAARPLVTEAVVRRCIDVADTGVGAVAGCPAVDTMKRVDSEAYIQSTPDRSRLWHAHTPQTFPARVLRAAYADLEEGATDDAALVEATGMRVRMIDDGGQNPKITRPGDLAIGEAILGGRGGDSSEVGG
ncbi:MAG: 2-C-methyl-D-erythritol 4-phosphate cytidylyltransferase [Gemmatimonadetes bacterium]|nr:2-C-methyl-D-erythritol 4-phosphate cytidylyltransferase [Gemmatimonadota bacterium]